MCSKTRPQLVSQGYLSCRENKKRIIKSASYNANPDQKVIIRALGVLGVYTFIRSGLFSILVRLVVNQNH